MPLAKCVTGVHQLVDKLMLNGVQAAFLAQVDLLIVMYAQVMVQRLPCAEAIAQQPVQRAQVI